MRIAIHRLAAIAAAFSLPLLLAACGGNKSAIDQATAGLPSGATVVNGIAVPPDPGPENDATLAGIDTTGSGVRDDVYRALAMRFGSNPVVFRAALQDAQADQMSVLANGDPTLSNAANDAEMASGTCNADVISDENGWSNPAWLRMGDVIWALTVDTPDRLSAFERTESINTPDIQTPQEDRVDCK